MFLVGLGIGSTVAAEFGAGLGVAASVRSAGASCCCAPRSRGRRTADRSRCRTGRSIRRSPRHPWFTLQLDLVRCFWAVLPGAILWGASFPLALAAVAASGPGSRAPGRRRLCGQHRRRHRRLAGRQLLLVAWIGSQHYRAGDHHRVSAVGAADARAVVRWQAPIRQSMAAEARGWNLAGQRCSRGDGQCRTAGPKRARCCPDCWSPTAAIRRHASGRRTCIYVGEGLKASVAVSELSNGVLNYHNAGKVQASSEPQDMRLQRMLGHLTTLLPPQAKKVVVIGCGAGVTAGAVSVDPVVTHETIAEIEPLVPARGLRPTSASTTSTSSETRRSTCGSTMRGTSSRHRREVRRDHVRSAGSVGEGRGDALHARVLRDGEAAPQPRRRRDAVRAAVREQHRGGEERDRHVLRGVPQRHRVRQHQRTARATTSCSSVRSKPTRIDVDADSGEASPARVRDGAEVAARDRLQLGGRSVLDLRRRASPTSSRGCGTRRSTAIATSGCSTWPASASISTRLTSSTPTCCGASHGCPRICSPDPNRPDRRCSRPFRERKDIRAVISHQSSVISRQSRCRCRPADDGRWRRSWPL